MRKPNVKGLKKTAWKLCSELVRRKYADSNGMVRCVCCNTVIHWKQAQAGHFVPGRANSILFDERGIYPCCVRCNIFKDGNVHEYMRFMENKFGVNYARMIRDDLIFLSKIPHKFTVIELEGIINSYKENLRKLNEHRLWERV